MKSTVAAFFASAPNHLFALGEIYMSWGALVAFSETGEEKAEFIERHVRGDWSEMDEADQQENKVSAENGFRVFSAYRLLSGEKIWIITEADRRSTTVLLPQEY